MITTFRNKLFDLKVLKETKISVFTIGIGNLSMGGTGKSPVAAYFIENLKSDSLAYLSRGYGRNSKGFIEIESQHTAAEVGDEAKMLYNIYHQKCRFFVGEDRVGAIEKIILKYPNIQVVILDDVFQHRYIKPSVNILLSTIKKPFYDDFVLPVGTLRETRSGASRADLVLITKAKDVGNNESIINKVKSYVNPATPVLFSWFENQSITNTEGGQVLKQENIVLISALADNHALESGLANNFNINGVFFKSDHGSFSEQELSKILNKHPSDKLVTTEKDWVKIKETLDKKYWPRFYVIKITLKLAQDNNLLLDYVENKIKAFYHN